MIEREWITKDEAKKILPDKYEPKPLIMTLADWHSKRKSAKKHKYGATRCESKDGVKFPSKLEKMYYERLIQAQKQRNVNYFLRQVPFQLPGNVKYLVDFMVVYHDRNPGEMVEFIDVKGKMLPMAILKIKQVEALYPVKIKIVDAKYLTQNHI